MRVRSMPVLGLLMGATLLGWACSGEKRSGTTQEATTPLGPSAGGVRALDGGIVLASPAPVASPSPVPSDPPCPYGQGVVDPTCDRTSAALLPMVEQAIDQLAVERPDIFDVNDQQGQGGYAVLKTAEYYDGVVAKLRTMGACAQFDQQFLQVKNSPDFSEAYDILTSIGHVRRGSGAYRSTCTPPVFPLSANELIDGIRVGFYGIQCRDREAPRNGEGILPLGCVGEITATPKDKLSRDVPPEVHGPDIEWELLMGEGEKVVEVEDDPRSAFNKSVHANEVGYFTLCATVKGVRGCLGANVVP